MKGKWTDLDDKKLDVIKNLFQLEAFQMFSNPSNRLTLQNVA